MKKHAALCHWISVAVAIPLAWMIGFLLLWGVYSLPNEKALYHAQQSVHIFWQEETHGSWIEGGLPNVQVDNIADACIIGMAANDLDIGYTPLQRALNAYYPLVPDKEYASCTHLATYLSDPYQTYDAYFYGRYWGGFALMARVWLLWFTFPQIRMINLFLQILVALWTCFLVWRELGWRGGISVILAYIALSPYTISLSMQYYPCFYLGFGGMAFTAYFHRRKMGEHAYEWLFLILGFLTAYLDFLTYPAAVVGLPLVIWLALNLRSEKIFATMLRLGLLWCIGYAGMWAGKWLLCAVAGMSFTGGTVAEKLSAYTGSTSDSLLDLILIPFRSISKKRLLVLGVPCLFSIVWSFWKSRTSKIKFIRQSGYFLLLMLIPLAWVVFTKGHSAVHDFLCNRNLTVFFAALFLMCSTLIPVPSNEAKQNLNEIREKNAVKERP